MISELRIEIWDLRFEIPKPKIRFRNEFGMTQRNEFGMTQRTEFGMTQLQARTVMLNSFQHL